LHLNWLLADELTTSSWVGHFQLNWSFPAELVLQLYWLLQDDLVYLQRNWLLAAELVTYLHLCCAFTTALVICSSNGCLQLNGFLAIELANSLVTRS
jgi:hypothetical protein